jgi:hypothetical protein
VQVAQRALTQFKAAQRGMSIDFARKVHQTRMAR